MKILFLTNIPSPTRVDFFEELAKGCDLTVLYELPSSKERDKEWKSSRGNSAEGKEYREVYLYPVWRKNASAWCPSVVKYLKKGMWDVVIVGGYSTPTGMHAIQCLRRRKIPYAINCDGGFVPQIEHPLKYKIKRFFLSGAVLYLCSGEFSDSYLKHYGANPEKIRHYPFSSLHEEDILQEPVAEEEKNRLRAELGWREKEIILSVGNFIPRKGFDVLLKAASELRDRYGVYIVGGGDIDQYRQFIDSHGLKNIHFLPFMKGTELKKCYMAADVFVLPTREDIWGLVINEAMAAGLPVITTDRCGAGLELLEQENIVPVENVKSLCDLIELFMGKQKLRRQVGYRNLEKIREYTIENMAKVHRDILAMVCNN